MKISLLDNNSRFGKIPPTAMPVKITNVFNPYMIRIYEIKLYDEKLNHIIKATLSKRRAFNDDDKSIEPKVGDLVLVFGSFMKENNLPGLLCRGCVSDILGKNATYHIFLFDYGISVVSRREDFILWSESTYFADNATFTVGLCNVLPAESQDTSLMQQETVMYGFKVTKEWHLSAIEYTKDLIRASQAIYFDPLARDFDNRFYGEFYLNIENEVLRLSEILVFRRYAIYLDTELLKSIKNVGNCEKVDTGMVNGKLVFCFKPSNLFNKQWKRQSLCESYTARRNPPKENYLSDCLNKKNQKVLIYGGYELQPFKSSLDAKFPTNVHKAWKLLTKSTTPKKLQSYMWPGIQNGLDVMAIAAKNSGKTFGSVFAICGLLAALSKLPQGVNPSALILCSTSSQVLEVNSLCTTLLETCETVKSVAAINDKPDRSLVAEMFNGCQILVSTPRYLSSFIDRNKTFLSFKSLRYLIIDNADIILDKYSDSIQLLFQKHQIIGNREQTSRQTIQIIVTATNCTKRLKKIVSTLLYAPYICVTSLVEAAIFKSVYPKVHLVNSKDRDKKILDLLGDEYKKRRSIIVCKNKDEAEKLYSILKDYGDVLCAHENMNHDELQGIKQYWNACVSDLYPILISTDFILPDMDITNASWLIHYSIALRYKTEFSYRFSTILDNLQSDHCHCKVTIVMDQSNDVQFLHMIRMMERINAVIPETIKHTAKLLSATMEERKKDYPICVKLKSLGHCDQQDSCLFRHKVLPDIDKPLTNLQINDKVKLKVVIIHDVTYFSARIVSRIKHNTSEEIEYSSTEYMQVIMKVQEFYSSVENRRRSAVLIGGCVYGLEEPVGTFKRVEILHIEKNEDKPKHVDVLCIDSGVILKHVNAFRLLHIPEDIVKYPAQTKEVFLIGVAPHDNEYVWNNYAIESVRNWFKENMNNKSYLIGTVKLCLGNSIWIDTLEIGTKLIGYQDMIGFSLKRELLGKCHAVDNDKHLEQLYQLCRDAELIKEDDLDDKNSLECLK